MKVCTHFCGNRRSRFCAIAARHLGITKFSRYLIVFEVLHRNWLYPDTHTLVAARLDHHEGVYTFFVEIVGAVFVGILYRQ